MTMSAWSIVLSVIATVIAVFTFARTLSRQLPTVEFLVERDGNVQPQYKLSVSNPTLRLLVLDYVDIFSPSADAVDIWRMHETLYGTVDRAYEGATLKSKRRKAVFLAVPAGQTRDVDITIFIDEDFDVDFRLHWSKSLPFPDRCFIARKIRLDSAQVKSRKIAAVARTARSDPSRDTA